MDQPFIGTGVPLKGVGPEHIRENAVRAEHILNGTITIAELAAALQALLLPTGAIMMWGNASPPTEWFMCDGAAKSRTTEAALFAVYGTTFGAGDGSTTFNLPNLNAGRFPLGKAAAGTGSTLGGTGGTIDHVHALDTASSHAKTTIQSNQVEVRRKTVASYDATHRIDAVQETGTTGLTLGTELGGDSGIANPPFQVVNFICKR